MRLTLETHLSRQPLFNPEATDLDTSAIGATNTNLNNLSNIKYPWARALYRKMRTDYWTPQIIDLTKDDKNKMTPDEREAHDDTLGFLVFLDSLQTINLPNIIDYITNPEIRACLIEQTSQEQLHSESYQEIFATLYTQEETNRIYYRFRENEKLLNRMRFITQLYQNFADDQTLVNFIDVIIANILLESLYFYVGFNFFYYLSNNNKMEGVASMIRLINIDEKSHIGIFTGIINAIKEQADDELKMYINNRIKDIVVRAIEEEFNWSVYITRNISSFTETDIRRYLEYLVERNILRPIGLELYGEVSNPYKYLEKVANIEKGTGNKGNFFESNSNAYNQVTAIAGYSDW